VILHDQHPSRRPAGHPAIIVPAEPEGGVKRTMLVLSPAVAVRGTRARPSGRLHQSEGSSDP
jgi:hypothetical protein